MKRSINRLYYEEKLWEQGFSRVMGLDEVGRGCLCGPVVASGVILDSENPIEGLRDSKTLTIKKRESLAEEIKEKALFWTIKKCEPDEIDSLNILKASIKAMVKCTESDGANPDYLLVDGNRFTPVLLPYNCIIKGDDESASIAAASILAKVYRDDLMIRLHEEFPFYGWDKNMGYPTQTHREALSEYGYTKHHRRSFSLNTDKLFSCKY
jgi:ribonuclease HII